MKPLTIAAAALVVFFLALSMVASAPAPAPANGMDRCLMCHPKAHPADWTQTSHVTDLKSGKVTLAECNDCHDARYCDECHAQVKAMKQQSGAASQQPATAP